MALSSKERLLAEIHQYDEKMGDIFPQLNTIDAILTLMAYIEILDNELTTVHREIAKDNNRSGAFSLLISRNIMQKIGIIRECMEYLYSVSNNKKTLSGVPPLESLITAGDENDPEVINWIQKNFDQESDEILFVPLKLLMHFDALRVIIWKGYHNTAGRDQIKLAMSFLRYFHMKKALQSLLNHNIGAEVSPDGEQIKLDGLLPEEILEKENYHPRTFAGVIDSFPLWKNDVIEINEETLLSTELNANSPLQREMFAKEHRAFYNEFAAIQGFSSRFLDENKVSLDNYREITLALERIALDHDPPVVFLPRNKVIRKVKKKSLCPEADVVRILDMFTCKSGEPMDDKRFLFDGRNYIFTWSMIVIPFQKLVEKVFHDYIDGNFKGLEFERECRKIVQRVAGNVREERLEIQKQIIPDEVSVRLWGKIKKKTDLDVLGTKGNFLFVIECKSEVQRLRRKQTQLNMFGKYHEELLNKAQWITKNYAEFSQLAESINFRLPKGISIVVPILVAAFIEPYKQTTIVSVKELDEILQKMPANVIGSELIILLDSNVELHLPVFQIV